MFLKPFSPNSASESKAVGMCMKDRRLDVLASGLRRLGLDGEGKKAAKIVRFLEEIDLWNPRYGLVAAGEDLVGRHVLDSLAGLTTITAREPRRIADIGSGAGFPGIPLAIWMENTEFSLIERSGKRAGFLRNIIALLELPNVLIIEGPVEDIDPKEANFDVVTFRAWSSIDIDLIEAVAPLLAPGGVIAAYKGRREAIDEEIRRNTDEIGFIEIRALTVPGINEERHLVLLEPKARRREGFG